eukprot:TRINITY_DN1438_c0_g1_i1.p1 TRINITY_DN1438_c0_g1~~TRINITY_DN1438_c0_g1_i1.p1  ORF type:complete len:239 (-),score=39.97 TRINITY_DN1438_c0_g1_i1:147-863(-)
MDIVIDLVAVGSEKVLLRAWFTMVARGPQNEPFQVPQLVLKTDSERQMFAESQKKRQRRRETAATSLELFPPNAEENLIVHELIYAPKPGHALVPTENMRTDSSARQTVLVMHPQRRNIHNKVFGGYLMRIAFEQGWAVAHLFTGTRPRIDRIFEQTFIAPVEIGSTCTFDSEIVYTTSNSVQVEVITSVENPELRTKTVTNTFYFTFSFLEPIRAQIKPRLYAEAMKYIEGRRRAAE